MYPKSKLKGKYVSFYKNGCRTQKVVAIHGNTLTVKDAVGRRTRIHPDKNKILGVLYRKRLEVIDWKS